MSDNDFFEGIVQMLCVYLESLFCVNVDLFECCGFVVEKLFEVGFDVCCWNIVQLCSFCVDFEIIYFYVVGCGVFLVVEVMLFFVDCYD